MVNQAPVGACVLLSLALGTWVGWVMCTLGSVALPVGLGSGSAGWAVALGGLGFFVSLYPCCAGFNFLVVVCAGGPPPLLPGVL